MPYLHLGIGASYYKRPASGELSRTEVASGGYGVKIKIPLNSNVLKNISKKRVIIFTSSVNKKNQYLKKRGCEIIMVKKQRNNQLNLKLIFNKIYELKIYDILVEAGGIFFTNILKNNLIDELHLFSTNKEIGENGIPMIIGKKLKDYNFNEVFVKKFKNDVYQNFKFY